MSELGSRGARVRRRVSAREAVSEHLGVRDVVRSIGPVSLRTPHGALQTFEPEILNLDDDPELKAQTFAWKERRDEFMKKFNANDAQTLKQAWQRESRRVQLCHQL